ncbi:MAG: MBOAT family O-acyltransferase, partial [Planctomycetota bacterium]|nr:MBOAT family O-acyltransferase [Planctomycetota bacterium]
SALFVFLFLPLILALYLVVHPRLRNGLLLLASLIFYAWGEPVMSIVMIVSITANYLFGLWVDAARQKGRGRGVIVLAIVFNLGLLIAFKYADWIWNTGGALLNALGLLEGTLPHIGSYVAADSPLGVVLFNPDESIRLPIGISFFTFQAFSYVIDVYRRDGAVNKNPLDIGLYVALFPQLIAGPIVRYRDVAAQIVKRQVTLDGFAYGVRRFVIGLGKKMLIANLCAEACDKVFLLPVNELPVEVAWLGIVCYTLQIYFDFSGYSDMAIGLGHMFGFKFLENFNYPYIARSITEFWRRWHISLSTWFRDYLYIPLGGNRGAKSRTYVNLVLVFFLCGLWHGANFTFIVWGLYHGLFLVIERIGFGNWLGRRGAWLQHAYTLLVVMVGWVFFRAEDMTHALGYLQTMFGLAGEKLVNVPHPPIDDAWIAASTLHPLALFANVLTWIAIVAGVIGSIPWLPRVADYVAKLVETGRTKRAFAFEMLGLVCLALIFVHVAMGLASGAYNPFIYFRF